MKRIIPYKTVSEALLSLDNGGRFYNILTKSDDGVINQAELGKVGGWFDDKQQMILFLDLSIFELTSTEKAEIISKLEPPLLKKYNQYHSTRFKAAEIMEKGVVSTNVIVSGIPVLIDTKSEFNGFIMMPIMVNNVTTFSMIPIIDEYDIYELKDEDSDNGFLMAHAKGVDLLPQKNLVFGGVLKELQTDESQSNSKTFLEAIYYIDN